MAAHMVAEKRAETVLDLCRRLGLRLATAESCTGGLIAAALTDIPGASAVVDCGFVTYSNEAKTMLVGVPAKMIESYGAVSRQVAMAMADGALQHSNAGIAVAVTGIAGPDGGSSQKPVGLVHMAVAYENHETTHYEARFSTSSGRDSIRRATVEKALELLCIRLQDG